MKRLLIVDDEPLARQRLLDLIGDIQANTGPMWQVATADSGQGAWEYIQSHPVDILIVDIHMPHMTGLELAAHLSTLPHPPALIFATAYDQHAIQAFELNAIDYLLKPIKQERLHAALQKAQRIHPQHIQPLEALQPQKQCIKVLHRAQVILLPVCDILFAKSDAKYICLQTQDKEYITEGSLQQLEQDYSATFLRIHRSCLVNRQAISHFSRTITAGEAHWVVHLKNSDFVLPISRRQQHIVKDFQA